MSRLLPSVARVRRAWASWGLLLAFTACEASEFNRLPDDASPNIKRYAQECDEGLAESCFALALVYQLGEAAHQGVVRDAEHAGELLERACSQSHQPACDAMRP